MKTGSKPNQVFLLTDPVSFRESGKRAHGRLSRLDLRRISNRAAMSDSRPPMDSPPDPTDSKAPGAISQSLPGPPFLRYYAAYGLTAWQPQGTLDDLMLDWIAEWLVAVEKVSLPSKRFVDLSQLTTIAIRTRHLFEFARKRAEQLAGVEAVRTALFCDEWVGFGIARLYETLMENTRIEVRAFRDRAKAAEWLGIPVDVLTLRDEPAPDIQTTTPEHS